MGGPSADCLIRRIIAFVMTRRHIEESPDMAVHQLDANSERRFDDRPSAPSGARTDWLQTIWAPRILSIVRIACGLIFTEHGTQKWLGFPPSGKPAPAFFTLSGFGGMLELVGGALL